MVATIRAGKVLYGDRSIVAAFDPTSMCDTFDVCGGAADLIALARLLPEDDALYVAA